MKKTEPKPIRITLTLLRKLDACADELDHFRRVFPKGADLNVGNVIIAMNNDFPVRWLATLGMNDRQLYGFILAYGNMMERFSFDARGGTDYDLAKAELFVKYIRRAVSR